MIVIIACEILLLGLLIYGAIQDILHFRLPNWLTLATAVVAVPWLAMIVPSMSEFLSHVAAGFGVLAVGVLAHRYGALGGGDVKWLASLALWAGLSLNLTRLLILTAILGGVLAVLVFAFTLFRRDYGLHDGKHRLPYGVAIAAAGIDFWFRAGHLGRDLVGFVSR